MITMSRVNREKPSGVATAKFYHEDSRLVSDAVTELAVKVVSFKKKFGRKIVLLTGCNASCGTTRTAINLAIALSSSGNKTLLIDTDIRKGSTLYNGLSDYFHKIIGVDDVIRETNIPNMDFAPSGLRSDRSALLLSSDNMTNFMHFARKKYDYVIIDCPSIDVSTDASAMFSNTDGIILICSLDKTTKRQIINARNTIEPYADRYYGMVVHSMEERRYKRHLRRRQWRV